MNFAKIEAKPTGDYLQTDDFFDFSISIDENDQIYFLTREFTYCKKDKVFLWICDPVINVWTKHRFRTSFFLIKLLSVQREKLYVFCSDDRDRYHLIYLDMKNNFQPVDVKVFYWYTTCDVFQKEMYFFERDLQVVKITVFNSTCETWTEMTHTIRDHWNSRFYVMNGVLFEEMILEHKFEAYDIKSGESLPVPDKPVSCVYAGKCNHSLYFIDYGTNDIIAFNGSQWNTVWFPFRSDLSYDTRFVFSWTSLKLYYVISQLKRKRNCRPAKFKHVTVFAFKSPAPLSLKELAILKAAERLKPQASREQLYNIIGSLCDYFKRI
jgi:hypothetical protein